jgi:fructose-specific phosphotransferase system IIC component
VADATADAFDVAAAALVRAWPAHVEGDELLRYAGVDLGAGAAFTLMPVVLCGYLAAALAERSAP